MRPSRDPAQDESVRIEVQLINNSLSMDATIDGMGIEHKTKFAGYLVDYIENNIPRYAQLADKPAIFENPRETGKERELKLKLIKKFNERPSRFPN